jgi:two-component system sensor histidine kinase CiaH
MQDLAKARIKLTLWYVLISYGLLALFTWAVLSAESKAFAQVIDLVHSHVRGMVFNVYLQQQIEDFESHFAQWLLLFDVIILIVATAASYFLSGRTLAPIERAMRDQQRFVGDVSHELRTPLASMSMELEAFNRTGKTKLQTESLLASLHEEIKRMSGLVAGLLKIVRLEADHKEAGVRAVIDWTTLISASICLVQSQAVDHKLEIHSNLASEGEVWGNADELKQVMLILLDNAIKYTPAGGWIDVSTRLVGKKCELTVFNSGQGISEVDLIHVFDRFYRGANARDEGNGLGLAIARSIIEAHGGSIAVASQTGVGVTFRVRLARLPIVKTDSPKPEINMD